MQLSGTIPSAYNALSWIALAYNPGLYGPLPVGFAAGSSLHAWSAYFGAYYPASQAGGGYGAAPTYGSGILYGVCSRYGDRGPSARADASASFITLHSGTSIGLNSSMTSILRGVQAGLDPKGNVLKSAWPGTDVQPCPPWLSSRAGDFPSQSNSTPGFGGAWPGVQCSEWSSLSTGVAVTMKLGGVVTLQLHTMGLRGTMPDALCQLTPVLTLLDVSRNNLAGTLPSCLGTTPAPAVAANMKVSVFDNMICGTIPSSYTSFSWVALAYNPLLTGALPTGFTQYNMAAYSGYFDWCVAQTRLRSVCTR